MWTCTKCHEAIEDELGACWKCGAERVDVRTVTEDADETVPLANLPGMAPAIPRTLYPDRFRLDQVFSQWSKLFENFETSALDFYEELNDALARREIPDLKPSTVEYLEGGAFSAKRIYFRAQRKGLHFDVCAAPFGTGYFFSWWCVLRPRPRWARLKAQVAIARICSRP